MTQTLDLRALERQGDNVLLLPAPQRSPVVEVETDDPGVVLIPPQQEPAPTTNHPEPAAKPAKAVATRPQRPGHEVVPFADVPAEDHAALMKGLRRRWLSAGFKRSQHTILLVRLTGEAGECRRVAKAIGEAMAPLGDVFAFGRQGRALVAPDKPVRHVVQIAQSLRAAVLGAEGTGPSMAAGVALIHRDDDPTLTLCTAERNLREAEAGPRGGVVTGADLTPPGLSAQA